jgi:hypothetical protein
MGASVRVCVVMGAIEQARLFLLSRTQTHNNLTSKGAPAWGSAHTRHRTPLLVALWIVVSVFSSHKKHKPPK